MNCQDIGRILNDDDIAELRPAVARTVREHLATCDECARDWRVHERVLAMPMPAPGPRLLGWRPPNRAAETVAPSRRALRSTLLVGALIAVGATAAVYVAVEQLESVRTTESPTAGPTSDDASSQEAPVGAAADSSPTATDELDLSAIRASRSGYAYAFTAVLAPSMTDPQYDEVAAVIEAALLEKLRSIPHLILIEPDLFDRFLDPDGLPRRPLPAGIDFLLQLQQPALANAETNAGRWSIEVYARISGDEEIETRTIWEKRTVWVWGRLDLPLSIEEAHSTIEGAFAMLSTQILPPEDLSLLAEMRNTALDSARPKEERLAVLSTLDFFFPHRFIVFDDVVKREVSRSIALTVTEIVTNSPDPDVRRDAWWFVRGLGDPYLVAPLAESMRRDPAISVRFMAADVLAREFISDPAARAAFDFAALNDTDLQSRRRARWATASAPDRKALLIDMLSDPALPQYLRYAYLRGSTIGDFVDYVTPESAELMLRAAAAGPQNLPPGTIITDLGKAPSGEVVPLLLERLRDDPDAAIRRVAASALIAHQDEPGVVEALRYAREYDVSPEVRLAASTER